MIYMDLKSQNELGMKLVHSNSDDFFGGKTKEIAEFYDAGRPTYNIICFSVNTDTNNIVYFMKRSGDVIYGTFNSNGDDEKEKSTIVDIFNKKIEPSITVKVKEEDHKEIFGLMQVAPYNINPLVFIQDAKEMLRVIVDKAMENTVKAMEILTNCDEENKKIILDLVEKAKSKIVNYLTSTERVDLDKKLDQNHPIIKELLEEYDKIKTSPMPQPIPTPAPMVVNQQVAQAQQAQSVQAQPVPAPVNQQVDINPNQPVDMGILMNNVVNGLNSFFTQQQPQPVFQMQDSIAMYMRNTILKTIDKQVDKNKRNRFRDEIKVYAEQSINYIYNKFIKDSGIDPSQVMLDQLNEPAKDEIINFANMIVSKINIYAEAKKGSTDGESINDFVIRTSTQSNPNNQQPSQAV